MDQHLTIPCQVQTGFLSLKEISIRYSSHEKYHEPKLIPIIIWIYSNNNSYHSLDQYLTDMVTSNASYFPGGNINTNAYPCASRLPQMFSKHHVKTDPRFGIW
jgi:hypothetical protein